MLHRPIHLAVINAVPFIKSPLARFILQLSRSFLWFFQVLPFPSTFAVLPFRFFSLSDTMLALDMSIIAYKCVSTTITGSKNYVNLKWQEYALNIWLLAIKYDEYHEWLSCSLLARKLICSTVKYTSRRRWHSQRFCRTAFFDDNFFDILPWLLPNSNYAELKSKVFDNQEVDGECPKSAL